MSSSDIQTDWTPERVKALRLSLGLTQEQFAARLHVARPTVARWETGKHPPLWHLARLLDQVEQEATV